MEIRKIEPNPRLMTNGEWLNGYLSSLDYPSIRAPIFFSIDNKLFEFENKHIGGHGINPHALWIQEETYRWTLNQSTPH